MMGMSLDVAEEVVHLMEEAQLNRVQGEWEWAREQVLPQVRQVVVLE